MDRSSPGRAVILSDARTGREVKVLTQTAPFPSGVAFSRDGKRLAADTGGDVVVWDVATGKEVHSLKVREAGISEAARKTIYFVSPVVSFEGIDRLCWADPGGAIVVWDLTTGRRIGGADARADGIAAAVAFSPDGRLVASAPDPRVALVRETATGRILHEMPGELYATLVALSPDGRTAAVVRERGTASASEITIWDLDAKRPLRTFVAHGTRTTSLVFGPDGRRLVSASLDRTVKVWDVSNGRELLALGNSDAGWMMVGATNGAYAFGFSADGQRLTAISGDRRVRVWDGTPR